MIKSNKNILFYDGECPFCNRAVNFVLQHKKSKSDIYFAPLQSKIAHNELKKRHISIKMDTLYLLTRQNKIYDKSSASILLTKLLKFPYNLFIVFYIVPKPIRDFFYNQIAKRRYRLGNSYCLKPDAENEKWFIS